jgi:hypothetical protein
MSGIFSIVDSRGQSNIQALINKMSDVISHRNWYVVETSSVEEYVGLGRVGNGTFNRPFWQ